MKEFSEAKATNDFLTLVKADILRHYNMLISTREVVTAVDVKNSYKGIKEIKKTFLQLFRQYNQQLLERKEVDDLSEGRYKRFEILYGKCKEFVKYKFRKTDTLLEDLKLNFVVAFEHYLRTVQKIGHNTSMKYAKDLKQVMKYGVMSTSWMAVRRSECVITSSEEMGGDGDRCTYFNTSSDISHPLTE